MPPLITREEALRLGELEDHAEIEALIERAWRGARRALRRLDRHVLARQREVGRLRRGLRLLRAVALRRGGDADARDDGARADPRARARGRGGRRAPLLHGHAGPGALQARLREGARGRAARRRAHQPQALRLDRAHVARARARRSRRPASSACTTTSRRPSPTTPRSRRPSATRAGCARSTRSARPGWRRCVGGILNLGESREQRVEMAFQLAEIDPTSVPINLLNPRPGTKFGDRDYMDPWEAVKWIAIFRLILPEALFRLCGGRVENIGELQRLAVRAGINGVMMGNFLTTLGNDARGGPRDVRGARPQRRAPARQRRQPAARTTARAGWRARRPTSSRCTSTRRRAGAHRGAALGSRRRSCASRASA